MARTNRLAKDYFDKESPRDLAIPAAPPEPAEPKPPAKVRITTMIAPEVLQAARRAVFWTGQGLTLSGLVEQALTEKLERLEKQRGEPFPEGNKVLKGGRPTVLRST
jgi:hypothetical protein